VDASATLIPSALPEEENPWNLERSKGNIVSNRADLIEAFTQRVLKSHPQTNRAEFHGGNGMEITSHQHIAAALRGNGRVPPGFPASLISSIVAYASSPWRCAGARDSIGQGDGMKY